MASRVGAVLLAVLALCGAPAAAQDPAQQARGQSFLQLPYWPGYWVSENQIGTSISGITRDPEIAAQAQQPVDPLAIWNSNVPWNDEGRRRVAEATPTQGNRTGQGWGYPLMMSAATPIQFLITPEEVLIINAYNEARHIYTDGRDHPPEEDLWPTVAGHSIGRWEGEVLVIDTIMVTNPNEYFYGGPPLSEEARYVERIWLEGDRLRGEMTIEDPVTLSAPWKARLAWLRDPAFDRMIQVDWNNDRTGVEGDVNTIEPAANEE